MGKKYNKPAPDAIQMSPLFNITEILGLAWMFTASIGTFYYLICVNLNF